ncbi:two component transcriptional regulator, LuxR family [Luminiphilus syltensis NOR5-1B]|uniref:Two component transcriptional regulator, LuxR family n=1 Tax=Luminiphilus syltensis NOR5-1B TaxID=565045 RepID=B8KRZ2_9GAMM|nr:response regulator transcription factor [Luminiphilus syltensis]EED36543.1 two component transcriptional regulator, LuxR family [Luminiphilus syltensis NOR5-1B]
MGTTICIADDHPLFGQALSTVISASDLDAEVMTVADVETVQKHLLSQKPVDLLMLDLHMPGAVGFSVLSWSLAQRQRLPIIIISANTHPETVRRALDHGAAAFLSKSAEPEVIVSTIGRVIAGERGLHPGLETSSRGESLSGLDAAEAIATMTAQQFRVVSMLVEGQLNKQIAYELGVKEATVKAHMTEIFRKLGVHSRTQAALVLNRLMPETNQNYEAPPSSGAS